MAGRARPDAPKRAYDEATGLHEGGACFRLDCRWRCSAQERPEGSRAVGGAMRLPRDAIDGLPGLLVRHGLLAVGTWALATVLDFSFYFFKRHSGDRLSASRHVGYFSLL